MAWGSWGADACASDLAPLGELTKLTKLHITGLQLGAGSAVSIEPLSCLQVGTSDVHPDPQPIQCMRPSQWCACLHACVPSCLRLSGCAVELRCAQALSELSLYGSASIIDAVPLGKLVSLKGLDLTARSHLPYTWFEVVVQGARSGGMELGSNRRGRKRI